MARFLHTADWQLGMTRRFLDEDAQARFSQARFDAIRSLGRVAEEHACQFIVVAGDVFESNRVDRRTIGRALAALGDVPLPVFLLPANHDPLEPGSVYRQAAFREQCPAHVRVLEDCEPVQISEGVELVGAPWNAKRPLRAPVLDALDALEPLVTGVRILAAHGALDALSPATDDPLVAPLAGLEAALAEQKVHYVALGDRHSFTPIGESGRVYYSGAPEPTDFDEVDPGKVALVDVERERVSVTPLEVGTWSFVARTLRLDGDDDLSAMEAWLDALGAAERTVLRLGLVGTLTLSQAARLERRVESASEVFAAVERWEPGSDLHVLPRDADFHALGLGGFAERAVDVLREHEDPDRARDALALLVRLAGSGA